jgi:hypothetical protein
MKGTENAVNRTDLRKGMVLRPVRQPETEERLCVLLDDVSSTPVRVQVAKRDSDGQIHMTGQEFVVPPSALDLLCPAGMTLEL